MDYNNMEIKYLADQTECVPILAKWFHEEWGYLSPECDLKERKERLRAKANRDVIPITFVAIDSGEPVGSASLVECDMDSHSHLKPWLSSVYVQTSWRRHGIGTALLNRVIGEAGRHGFAKLYLWTPKAEKFYAERGWQVIERTTYKNENAVVMAYTLGT